MFSVFDTVAMDCREVRRLIEHYFHCGFENQVTVDFLNNRHGDGYGNIDRYGREYGDREYRPMGLRISIGD